MLKKTQKYKRDGSEENKTVLNWNLFGEMLKTSRTSCWDSAIDYVAMQEKSFWVTTDTFLSLSQK